MKSLRNIIAAAALSGASFAAGTAVDNVDFTAARCADGWTQTDGRDPGIGDHPHRGQSFIVCEDAARRVVTVWEDGIVYGQNPDGSSMLPADVSGALK